LPTTLVELRRQIVAGERTAANAIDRQVRQLALDATQWHSVVHALEPAGQPVNDEAPLGGVGLAHKDIFSSRLNIPRCGTGHQVRHPDDTESPVIQRLADQGAVSLAALSMAEFAAGVTAENPALPLTRNPLFPGAMVGGSSSGSAAAVAAGLCYASLGTDTAGSVRIPAASCGVLGLKPTAGLLSTRGCQPLAPGLDTVGVLARSARDAAQVLAAGLLPRQRDMVLPDFHLTDASLDLRTWHEVLGNDLQLPDGVRFRVCLDHCDRKFSLRADQHDVLQSGLAALANVFAVQTVSLQQRLSEWIRLAAIVMHSEAAATHYAALRAGTGLNQISRFTTLPGAAIPAAWYAQALRQAAHCQADFLTHCLGDADILLTPVFPHGVPDWDDVLTTSDTFKPVQLLGLFSWTSFVNYLGLPAIVFPVGTDPQGRPVCIQAIARPYAERVLLGLAHWFEMQHCGDAGFVGRPPALYQTIPN
jgi:aspartyl-tRNA(Asn)/glutamyl-tRNA(Gln) amidotransferase subunit A